MVAQTQNLIVMTPVIFDLNTNEVVFEGIDFIDCFNTLRSHFMRNNGNIGRLEVRDLDTGEKADYAAIKAIQRATRDMLSYGG